MGDNNLGQIYAFTLNVQRDGFDFSALPGLQDLVADSAASRGPQKTIRRLRFSHARRFCV